MYFRGLAFQLRILALLGFTFLIQQQAISSIDSLEFMKNMISNAKTDVEKGEFYYNLALKTYKNTPNEAIEVAEKILEIGQRTDNKNLLAKSNLIFGLVYHQSGKYDSAFNSIKNAKYYSLQLNDLELDFGINNEFGKIYNRMHHQDSAVYYYTLNLEIAKKLNSPNKLAGVYNNLGMISDDKGEIKQAFDYYSKAFEYYEKSFDTINIAIIVNNLAIINAAIGDYNKAILYLNRAILLNEKTNNQFDLCMNYGNLGAYYKELKEFDKAKVSFNKSLSIALNNNFIEQQARVYMNFGNLYKLLNDFENTTKSYKASLEICIDNNLTYGSMLNYFNLAEMYYDYGQIESAETNLKLAQEICSELGNVKILLKIYELYSRISEKKGNFLIALDYFKKYNQLSDSLTEMANKTSIHEIQTKYETEKKEFENAKLRSENTNKALIIRNQRITNFAIAIAFLLMCTLAYFIFRSRQKKQVINEQLRALNSEVQNQNSKLSDLNTTKDKLFSIIAHDLKSPFNSLLGFLQFLIDDPDGVDEEEKNKILQVLYQQSNTTYSLLENLLQWAMVQRDHIGFNPELLSFYEIAEIEIQFLKGRADKKNITVKNQITTDCIHKVDKDMVHIIFRNLINNAIKFSNNGGNIIIDSRLNPNNLIISVTDHGIGIPEHIVTELQSELTNFYTTKGTENENGTGLGLMIVKEFIFKHNATLSIDSIEGKGSTFSIYFPITN